MESEDKKESLPLPSKDNQDGIVRRENISDHVEAGSDLVESQEEAERICQSKKELEPEAEEENQPEPTEPADGRQGDAEAAEEVESAATPVCSQSLPIFIVRRLIGPKISKEHQKEKGQDVTGAPPAAVPDGEKSAEMDVTSAAAPDREKTEAEDSPQPSPKPKAEWKILDPDDPGDPVDLEVSHFEKRDEHWNILAASVRGKSHAHNAKWRDDAYAFDYFGDWTVMAVADGAGSASLSRVGARIACETAVTTMKVLLTDYKLLEGDTEQLCNSSSKQIEAFFNQAACRARDSLQAEAVKRNIHPKELYTTLLLTVHTMWKGKSLIFALQVGDGSVAIFSKSQKIEACTILGTADHGEMAGQTVFMTSHDELLKRPFYQRLVYTLKPDVRCVAAMCDGVADDFFPEKKRMIELFNGDPISELKTRAGEPVKGVMHEVVKNPGKAGVSLIEWLKYELKGSADDRTLVLMYRSEER